MTLLTRALSPALAGAAVAAVVVGTLAVAPANASPPINPIKQHTRVQTKTTAGQRRDTTIYAVWARDRKALPTVGVRGANEVATTSTWESDSPVPGLSHSGASGYCVTQAYRLSSMTPTAGVDYRTSVVVYRHGRIVARHTSAGAFQGRTGATGSGTGQLVHAQTKVRLPHFHFAAKDRVVWTYSGTVKDSVNKFSTTATIAPTCKAT